MPDAPGNTTLVQGKQGLSAYQLAVSNGFQGTEQAWLDSLKGESGNRGVALVNRGNWAGGTLYSPNEYVFATSSAGVGTSAWLLSDAFPYASLIAPKDDPGHWFEMLAAPGIPFVPTSRKVDTQYSLTGGGNLSTDRTLNLVGDVASPGANKVYGTDGSGVRGWYTGGGGGGTGDVVGPASSIDSEIALFSGTTGKLIKRATGSGLATLTSGVLGTTANNTSNWDSAFSERRQWDGGSTNLVAATGRTSLGLVSLASAGLLKGKTIWVDGVNGNDGTGTRGREDLPFLTISAAIAAAGITSGDVIVVGPGTFSTTTNQLPTGVHLVGQGRGVTKITSTSGTAGGHAIIAPGSGSVIARLTIDGSTGSNASPTAPIGALTNDSAFTSAYVYDCEILGNTDGFYIDKAGTTNLFVYNTVVSTTWDTIFVNAGTGPFEFFNCTLLSDGSVVTGGIAASGVNAAGGTTRVHGGRVTITSQSSPVGFRAQTAGTRVDAIGVRIDVSGTGTPKDLSQASSATTAQANCYRGDGAALDTTGTITQLSRYLIRDNNLSDVVNTGTARTNLGLAIGVNVQAWDTDLDTWATLTPSANFQTMVPHTFAQMRTDLGLVIGTNVQAWDADLDALAALSGTNNIYYRSASNTWSSVTFTAPLAFSGGALNFPDFVASGASHARGAVPDPGASAGTSKFLREDATWATPAGGGNVSNTGTPVANQIAQWTSATVIQGVTPTSPIITSAGSISLSTGVDYAWQVAQTITNSIIGTNNVNDILTLTTNSTGTPANGFGNSIHFQLESSTTNAQDAASLQVVWGNATHANRTSYFDILLVNNAAALASAARVFASGSLSVGSTTDPGTGGIINANTGFRVANAATTGNVLRGNGTNFISAQLAYTDLSGTPTIPVGANPTASVGLAAVNGSSANFLRADGAPALSQAIAPAWTGQHTFSEARSIASGASAVLDDVNVSAQTTTVTGSTQITTAKGFNKVSLYRPTYTDGSAVTIDQGATLYIEHSPLAAGSVTLTNPYALWVDNGTVRLDGGLTVGGTAAPSAGVINASTGFTIGGAAATGKALVADGTNFTAQTISGSGATISLGATGVLTISGIANASLTNSAITIAGTSTSLGGSITLDTITGLGSTGLVKRTGANTLAIATAKTDYWDTTDFVASGASHAHGLVPDPGASAGTTKFLREDATWAVPPGGGGGSPGGADTNVQFNDGGAFGGDADLTWDKTNNILTGAGPFRAGNGSVTAPGLSFKNSTNTGLYYVALSGDALDFTIGGNWMMMMHSSRQVLFGATEILGWTGTTGDPSTGSQIGLARNASGILEVNNGTASQWGAVKVGTRDATTNATSDGLTIGHQTTGTPAANLGSAILFNIDSTTTPDDNAGRIAVAWSNATTLTVASYMDFQVCTGGSNPGSGMRLHGSTGLSVGHTTDPGAGYVSANTGFKVGSTDIKDTTQTLTNKRITPRVTSITSNATWSPSADNDDTYKITAQAVAATTISNPSGTPVDQQKLIIAVKDDGTARALTWSGTKWAATDTALPTTTVAGKWMMIGFIYNSTADLWFCVSKSTQA